MIVENVSWQIEARFNHCGMVFDLSSAQRQTPNHCGMVLATQIEACFAWFYIIKMVPSYRYANKHTG